MNKTISFVVTMAGLGKRFREVGYREPKYMIKVMNKTLFEYSLQSLPLDLSKQIVFVTLKEHEEQFNVRNFIKTKMLNIFSTLGIEIPYAVVTLDHPTRGQAETVLKAADLIDRDEDLAIYNIDTFFRSMALRDILSDEQKKRDGVIGAFLAQLGEKQWSFAEVDETGIVRRTAEKDPISKYGLTGFYHFSRASDFLSVAQDWVTQDKKVKGEFYVAPMYNDLVKDGKQFVLDVVEELIPLGTPEDILRVKAYER